MGLTSNELMVLLSNADVQQQIREIVNPPISGTLKYNLPEENNAHKIAVNSMDIVCGCHDYRNLLRNWVKHGGHDFKTVQDALDAIYRLYYDMIEIEIPEE